MPEQMTTNGNIHWTRYSRTEFREAWAAADNEAIKPFLDHVSASFFCAGESMAEVWSARFVRHVLASPRYCHYADGVFTVALGQFVDYGNGCADVDALLKRCLPLFDAGEIGETAGLFAGDALDPDTIVVASRAAQLSANLSEPTP